MLFRFSRGWKVKVYLIADIVLLMCLLLMFIRNTKLAWVIMILSIPVFAWTFIMLLGNFYYKRKLRGEIFMSKRSSYLNYSRGLSLQNLCIKIEKENDSFQNFAEILNFIDCEKRNLRKNQSSLWQCAVSDIYYYEYLEKLEKILENGAAREEIAELYQEIVQITRKKVYMLFLIQEPACWPSIESVFNAASHDPECETALVYTQFFHQNYMEQVDYYDTYANEMKLPVIRCSEYNLPKESPDVVFMIKPYGNVPEQFQIKHLQRVVPRAVYIPYGMEITTDLAKFGFQYYLHYKAWKHCAYGNIVKEYAKTYGYRNGENIAVWGHPKADHYIDMSKNKENIPNEWKTKINGRKVVLWTPHHLIGLDENGTGTWLIWGGKILKFIQENQDVMFIFRPHPLMMGALVHNNFMTEQEVKALQRKIESMPNVIYDSNPSYHNAFDAADAIITDGTTFSIEFLYTKKPILLTPRNMDAFYQHEEMLKSYYVVNEEKDIENFIKLIRQGEDPLHWERMKFYHNTFFIPKTGTVGENIVANVKKELKKECLAGIEEERLEKNSQDFAASDEGSFGRLTEEKELPLISVLVLCYENTNLLYGMLDTILAQDYLRIELIVSDDGSKDFDRNKIMGYIQSKRKCNIESVQVLKNEENIGTVKHVDHVLRMSKGEFVVITAADDRFASPDVMSSYVESFVSDDKAMWIVAQCSLTSPDYKKTLYTTPTQADRPHFESRDAKRLFSRWSRRSMAVPCCMAFRREAIELIGGIDLNYKYLEDWPLILKLLRQGHAPLFLNKITAIHSTGGVSNSNNRYGVKVRKEFYEDKYMVFEKEVEPYKKKLFPEDKKAYRQYCKEILERHYFFYITCREKTKKQLFWYMLKKPIRFWWRFENAYMSKIIGKVPRKKMVIASHILLIFAFFFFQFRGETAAKWLFYGFGFLEVMAALVLLFGGVGTVFLERHFKKKAQLRKMLVN